MSNCGSFRRNLPCVLFPSVSVGSNNIYSYAVSAELPSLILVLAQSVVEESCVHLVTTLEVHEFADSVLVVGQPV